MSKIVDTLEKLRAANKGKVEAKLQANEVALLLGYIVTLEEIVEKATAARIIQNDGFDSYSVTTNN